MKFIIIEPNQQMQYTEFITKFLFNFSNIQSLPFKKTDKKMLCYLIALRSNGEYLGGAYLIKRLSKTILKETNLLALNLKSCTYLWEFGGIHLICHKRKNNSHFAAVFYPELYTQLISYCWQKSIRYVCVHTTYTEQEKIQQYGKLPMVGHITDSLCEQLFYSFLNITKISSFREPQGRKWIPLNLFKSGFLLKSVMLSLSRKFIDLPQSLFINGLNQKAARNNQT